MGDALHHVMRLSSVQTARTNQQQFARTTPAGTDLLTIGQGKTVYIVDLLAKIIKQLN